jgi:hypothetical protein
MHDGEFLDALKTFEKAGGIHWADKQPDALRAMAEKYSADSLESPEKHRFMFAFSNAEVDALNNFARDLHKSRGELGADHALQTSRGEAHFATGDRIQLTASGTSKADRDAGFVNGLVGTIAAIDIEDGKPWPHPSASFQPQRWCESPSQEILQSSNLKAASPGC